MEVTESWLKLVCKAVDGVCMVTGEKNTLSFFLRR